MGYVGQHLVSVVTGFQGGRSGARGKDLILPNDQHAEIKTCYRVDQLGVCTVCGAVVTAIETECPNCGSEAVKRKDDSKWLIVVRTHKELIELFDSTYFYLVLFDFVDLSSDLDIYARIWRVSPRTKAFAYCMIDYYHNIRSGSSSGAPFNLWPFKLKFDLLLSDLIFQARIGQDDNITIETFEGEIGSATRHRLPPLSKYARSGGSELSVTAIRSVAQHLDLTLYASTKSELLSELEEDRLSRSIADEVLAEALCDIMYGARISGHYDDLPSGVSPPAIWT